jgi:hypothetical protein
MVRVRDWLRVFRTSTSPLTVVCVEVFYLIAGGPFLSLFNLLLILWAILLHFMAYGHNALMDTARGLDQENPHMKKQPLTSGSLGLNNAHNVINWLMLIAILVGLLIVLSSPGQQVLALTFLVVYIVSGHAYNDGLDKATVLSFIPATLSFTSLCAASYFLYATSASQLFILALVYIILTQLFMIGWEGYLKDVTFGKEPNLLRSLGVKVEKSRFNINMKGRIFGYGLRIAAIVVMFIIGSTVLVLTVNVVSQLIAFTSIAVFAIVAVFSMLLIEGRDYSYDRDLIYVVVEDFASIALLLLVLVQQIGAIPVISMISFAIIWFIIFNEISWSSLIKTAF